MVISTCLGAQVRVCSQLTTSNRCWVSLRLWSRLLRHFRCLSSSLLMMMVHCLHSSGHHYLIGLLVFLIVCQFPTFNLVHSTLVTRIVLSGVLVADDNYWVVFAGLCEVFIPGLVHHDNYFSFVFRLVIAFRIRALLGILKLGRDDGLKVNLIW